MTYIFHLSCK